MYSYVHLLLRFSHREKYKTEMAKIQKKYIRDCLRNSYSTKCTKESWVAAVSQWLSIDFVEKYLKIQRKYKKILCIFVSQECQKYKIVIFPKPTSLLCIAAQDFTVANLGDEWWKESESHEPKMKNTSQATAACCTNASTLPLSISQLHRQHRLLSFSHLS